MAEKDWTAEQAMAAQRAFMVEHPGQPRGPVCEWNTLHELDDLEKAFAAGDKGAVLHAVYLCALDDLVMPEWLSEAFRRQYIRGLHGHLSSWHDVFGRPKTKGQMSRFMHNVELQPKVWGMVAEAKHSGEPIGDMLFERIAKTLGTNRDKVAKVYSAWCRSLGKKPWSDF